MDIAHLLIYIVIICAIIGLAWYAISQIPLPPPARIVLIVIACIIGIMILASFLPSGSGAHLLHY